MGAGFFDDSSHILVGGRVTVVVPVQLEEDLRYVFLRTVTCGRLLGLGVNPLEGSTALDSLMGDCPWDLSLG